MIYYREHKGSLKESLKTLKKFKNIYDFKDWYFKTHNCTVLEIYKYSEGVDYRIDWPYTLLVVDNQFYNELLPSGFLCDTELKNSSEFSLKWGIING